MSIHANIARDAIDLIKNEDDKRDALSIIADAVNLHLKESENYGGPSLHVVFQAYLCGVCRRHLGISAFNASRDQIVTALELIGEEMW